MKTKIDSCSKCGVHIRAYWMKDGLCHGCRNPHLIVEAKLEQKGNNINIDTELSLEYRDEGPWRSYHLSVVASSRAEALANATISEVDQDGGELACYGVDECGSALYDEILQIINETWDV